MERPYHIFAVSFLLLLVTAGGYKVWTAVREVDAASIQTNVTAAQMDNKRKAAALSAVNLLGSAYQTGGTGPNEYDCSGLVYSVFKDQYSCNFPRSSYHMHQSCHPIPKDSLQMGDWVFFDTNGGMNRVNHVGIYLRNDTFIHSSTRRGVIYSRLDTGFYHTCFWSAGRFSCN